MAYLEIETRDGTHRVNLERDRLSIGRLSYNDVVLPFAQISRQHAEMRLIDNQWWIADLHSTNGLLINSRRVQEYALNSGDQIVLAPGINIRFVQDAPPATRGESQPGMPAQAPRTTESATSWAERIRQQLSRQGAGRAPSSPTHPVPGVEPFVPPSSVAPLGPRSPFADDEVRYVPPGMQSPEPPPLDSMRSTSAPAGASWQSSGMRNDRAAFSNPGQPLMNGSIGHVGNGSGGYPAPPGPLRSGAGPSDPYLRDGPADERHRITSGPAPKVLHVCQTCGQLTAPDSVYCQSCHHSIAHECSNCRLSLLPIQERCPRCHTPNASSVRRTHPRRTDL